MTESEKARAYDKALEKAKKIHDNAKELRCVVEAVNLETIFPELQESKDEKIRNALIRFHKSTIDIDGIKGADVIAWLEKQGKYKDTFSIPTKETIISIWELGNDWKDITHGSISTKYGTQLEYIQKHWQESEYYLEKQGEQKPAWSDEDEEMLQSCTGAIWAADSCLYEEKQEMEVWLKSLKDRIGG